MGRRAIPLLLAIALSAAGVVFSAQLLSKHMLGGGAQWFEQLCDWGAAGGGGCDAVLASKWAVIPPATEEQRRAELEDDQPATRRLYVAGLGLVYFSTLTVWFAGVGAPSCDRRFLHYIVLAVLAAGLCGSIFLLWALWSDARAFCPGCFFSHVANFGVFACAIALRPRKPASNDGTAPTEPAAPPHPTGRVVLLTLAAAWLLVAAELSALGAQVQGKSSAQCMELIDRYQDDTAALIQRHLGAERLRVSHRADDPLRYGGEGRPTLTVFSDLQCSHCREFAEQFETKIRKDFDDYIQVFFKHYPGNTECNPHVKNNIHPNACEAARAAEAARLQGGSDAFWKAHDVLFSRRKELAKLDYAALASELGLDPGRFVADMNGERVQARIAEDIEQGHGLGLSSTPGVFLNGRAVDSLARSSDAFWKGLGKAYNAKRAEGATQDSQDQ